MSELVQGVLSGSRRAIARTLTIVENEGAGADELVAALYPHTGRARIIGVTGAPGTGKSTLVSALAKAYRAQDKTVGIIAVDPTSPFSGGAIMGDRIRMRDLSGDSGVFIRSMATRGSLGGLSRATRDGIRVLDAGGFDIILVETVGAGQSEVDIVRTAQTTLVVDAPGMGDDVQAIKAGILEIADVLIVNKADKPGADSTAAGLKAMLELGHPGSRDQLLAHHGQLMQVTNQPATDSKIWIPPVLRTIASEENPEKSGVAELIKLIEMHRQHLIEAGLLQQIEQQHIQIELYERLRTALMTRLLKNVPENVIASVIDRLQQRTLDPQSAVKEILTAGS